MQNIELKLEPIEPKNKINTNIVNKLEIKKKEKPPRKKCIIVVSFIIGITFIVGLLLILLLPNLMSSNNTLKTNPVNQDSGSIFALAKIDVQCGNYALQYFGLKLTNDKMYYEFKCVQVSSSKNINQISKQTNWGDVQKGDDYDINSGNYLDRHDLDCGEGFALSQFNLEIDKVARKIRYNYTCLKMKFESCKSISTKFYEMADPKEGRARIIYLSNAQVEASANYVLQRFKINTLYGKNSFPNFSYVYTQCSYKYS